MAGEYQPRSGPIARATIEATSAEQVEDLLRTATGDKSTVVPFGGGLSLGTGNPSDPADLGLDLAGLDKVLAYEPADLTLSVQAGATVAAVQAHLAEQGQELPIDVPFPDRTTIGGLVATGFAGPRRLRSGSLRDLLIGCEYVRGDGLRAKAGGMVVKNVSGFEIPRFLHGSWGSLAVMTSVNLKVMPKPRHEATIVAAFDDLASGSGAAMRLVVAAPALDACVVTIAGGEVTLAARASGRPRAVSETLDGCAATLGAPGERREAADSAHFWQDSVNAFAERDDVWLLAIGVRPRDIHVLVAEVVEILGDVSGAAIQVSPGTGSIRIRLDPAQMGDGLPGRLANAVTNANGTWVVESTPERLRGAIAPWGAVAPALAVMQAIKQEFDPAGVLNPQRLFV